MQIFKCRTVRLLTREKQLYFPSLNNFSTNSSSVNLTQPEIPQESPTSSHYSHTQKAQLSLSDQRLYISSLLNCKNVSDIKQVHVKIIKKGALNDIKVANKLLYLYARHNAIDHACALFDKMAVRDPVSWSVMVGGFAKVGDSVGCFKTFREIIRCWVAPDNFSLPLVIRACRDKMDLRMGRLIHSVVIKSGLCSDLFVSAVVLDMYAKCRAVEEARMVFDDMPEAERDVVTWTAMIGAYGELGDGSEALVLFDRMREVRVAPDCVTMVNVVNACARVGAMFKARMIHEYVVGMRMPFNLVLGTAMIDMYAKCGSVDSAREIFDSMREKNVVTWSTMIAAYGYHGMGVKAINLFDLMLRSGVSPNEITFVSLLYACSHSGLVEEGRRFFSMMQDCYSIKPDIKHYTCVVDLLGRSGKLDEAMELIEDAGIQEDEGLWTALLGGCRIHGNVDIADKAAKSLLELQPQNPGPYVLLSNIFAKAQRWQDVAKIREHMTRKNLKKVPGWTCIEIHDKVYQFTVGPKNHPRADEIYQMLDKLKELLESAGYVPDTSYVLQDVDEELKKEMLYSHSERLALAFGLIATSETTPIRMTKNLRVCGDCHTFLKVVSAITQRVIIVRDANRFHQFREGVCSCGDYW